MKELEHVKAFVLAQAGIDTAFKNAKNPFLKNKYADLSAIQNAVFPSFHANGFAILQMGGADEIGRYIETKFIHTSGGEFSGKIYLEWKANDMQSLGAAITYARRYGLSSMSGVPVEDDDGNAASGITSSKRAEPKVTIDEDVVLQRGMALMRYLETADLPSLDAQHKTSWGVIKQIETFDKHFAQRIKDALELKRLALETKK